MAKEAKYPPIMSRTAFCPKCAKAGRPGKETIYITYCSKRDTFAIMLHIGENRPPIGMTPHLFTDPHEVVCPNGKRYVVVKSICYVNGCGVTLTTGEERTVYFNRRDPDMFNFMSPERFQSLVEFTDKELQLGSVKNIRNWDLYEIVRGMR